MTQEIAARTGATKPQRPSESSPDLALLSGKSLKLTTPQPARHLSPITKATALANVIAIVRGVRRYEDLSIGKIDSLLKLVA